MREGENSEGSRELREGRRIRGEKEKEERQKGWFGMRDREGEEQRERERQRDRPTDRIEGQGCDREKGRKR